MSALQQRSPKRELAHCTAPLGCHLNPGSIFRYLLDTPLECMVKPYYTNTYTNTIVLVC